MAVWPPYPRLIRLSSRRHGSGLALLKNKRSGGGRGGTNSGTPFWELTDITCSGPYLRNCTGVPFSTSADWIARWVLQVPDVDLRTLTLDTKTIAEYNSIIRTNIVDLRAFQEAGGKMVTWHGLADELILFWW